MMTMFKRIMGLCLCLVLLASFWPGQVQAATETAVSRSSSFAGVKGPTLVKQNGVWYYVKNGNVCYDTTLVKFSGSWYYVKNGTTQPSLTTLVKYNGEWWYVVNGKVASNTTSLVKYNGEWWYVIKGKIASNTTNLIKYNNEWFYVVKGKMAGKTTTLIKYNGGWYYIYKGKLAAKTTTLFKYAGKWYYVENGKVNFSKTTLFPFNNRKYYVKGGIAQTRYSGAISYDGRTLFVKNGALTDCHTQGHYFAAATCAAPKTCTKCSTTKGTALAHTWLDATCQAPKTCSVCRMTSGEPKAHEIKNGLCRLCNKAVPVPVSEFELAEYYVNYSVRMNESTGVENVFLTTCSNQGISERGFAPKSVDEITTAHILYNGIKYYEYCGLGDPMFFQYTETEVILVLGEPGDQYGEIRCQPLSDGTMLVTYTDYYMNVGDILLPSDKYPG